MPFVAGFTLASEVVIASGCAVLGARMDQLTIHKLTLG